MSLDISLFARRPVEVFEANITHNLGKMARECGLHQYLWRPEELEITVAGDLIQPLIIGLARLKADPERYKKFAPENGWGTYVGFVLVVEEYLAACKKYPESEISISR